jgi:pimeloyl-ACP methyl ester carboxylesterase
VFDTPLDYQDDVIADYVWLAIDQRGVSYTMNNDKFMTGNGYDVGTEKDVPAVCNFTETNSELVLPFPGVHCDEIGASLANMTYAEQIQKVRDVVLRKGWGEEPSEDDARIILAILSEGRLPVDSVHGISIFNETYVRLLYRVVELEINLCVWSHRYELEAPDGKVYNLLSYVGTGELVKDMDQLRSAIGMNKLSVNGGSYGTAVAGAYATAFPNRVGRLLMDGVVPPDRLLVPFFESFSQGVFNVLQGIMTDCAQSVYQDFPEEERCPLAPGAQQKVINMINDKSNLARAAGVYSMFAEAAFDITLAPAAVNCAAVLYDGEVPPLLENDPLFENYSQVLQLCGATGPDPGEPHAVTPKFDRFGSEEDLASFIAAVDGMDIAGRLGEEAFVTWWRSQLQQYPFGVYRSVHVMAMVAAWPLYAQPLPPSGKAGVPALIVGNLHDAQTDYSGAQRMRENFPKSSLVTWQGYGHGTWSAGREPGTNETQVNNDNAIQACKEWSYQYLANGTLPPDGQVCMMDRPLILGPSAFSAVVGSKPELFSN